MRQAAQDSRHGLRWILPFVWAIIAVGAALVSLPHTLKVLNATVSDLSPWAAVGFSMAAFVTVELSLIALAFIAETKAAQDSAPKRKASIAGAINALAGRVGVKPPFDLRHVQMREETGGQSLALLLLAAAVIFNLADTLAPVLPDHAANIQLLSKITAGLLGPVALFLAGHYLAQSTVDAAMGERIAQDNHTREMEKWQASKDQSWQRESDKWISAELKQRGYVEANEPNPFAVPATVGASNGSAKTNLNRA
jgi:hypothetical protein